MATDCVANAPISSTCVAPPQTGRSVTVEVIDDPKQAISLWYEWEQLAAGRLFMAPRWLMTWWTHFQSRSRSLSLLAVKNAEGRLVGIAPWYRQNTWWGGRELRALGDGEVCSDYLSLPLHADYREHVLEAMADWLVSQAPTLDRVYLEGIDANETELASLADRLASRHCFTTLRHPALEGYRLPLPSNWEEYVSQLSPHRRTRLRQIWRRQFDTQLATIQVAHDEESLKRGFAILVQLHQKRHKGKGEAGCFASKRFHDFLREAAATHLEVGQLYLQWIELEGKPVAVQLDLQSEHTVYDYCSGIAIDSSYPRPGSLGISAGIRHALETGRSAFDFLRGDEGYKLHWRGQPARMVNLEWVPPNFAAATRAGVRAAYHAAKPYAKRLLRRSEKSANPDAEFDKPKDDN